MKKLKIFLLLSILLCIGLFLNNNVSASSVGGEEVKLYSTGPKAFEVNDILPATTLLKVSWTSSLITYINSLSGEFLQVETSAWNKFNFQIYNASGEKGFQCNVNGVSTSIITDHPSFPNFISPYTDFGGDHPYIIVDTSLLSEIDRTITIADNIPLVWEDLNASSSGDIYQDGYLDGYEEARNYYGWNDGGEWFTGDEVWGMAYDHARDIFGYYDPITERWLSVEEYLDLYTGQGSFYNNFDKYFIPAMIIVFGGAIVLTILKVFKGRE